MAVTNAKSDTALLVRRTVAASRDRVYAAWTDPEQIRQWHAPGDFSVATAEVDLSVGGRYRFGMKHPEKDALRYVGGVYEAIEPGKKLVYTWQWEQDEDNVGETRVSVEFRDADNGTEIVLVHERFPTTATRDHHSAGWNGCIDKLVHLYQLAPTGAEVRAVQGMPS